VFVLLVEDNRTPKLSIWQMVDVKTCRLWERSLSREVVEEHMKLAGINFEQDVKGFEEIGDYFRDNFQIPNLQNMTVDPTTNALSFEIKYDNMRGKFELFEHKDFGIEAWTTILALTQMLETSPNRLKRSLEP
jgi:hypothetical protein